MCPTGQTQHSCRNKESKWLWETCRDTVVTSKNTDFDPKSGRLIFWSVYTHICLYMHIFTHVDIHIYICVCWIQHVRYTIRLIFTGIFIHISLQRNRHEDRVYRHCFESFSGYIGCHRKSLHYVHCFYYRKRLN